jgi:hypothetical protein
LFVCADDQQPTAITLFDGAAPLTGAQVASDVQKKSSIPLGQYDADDSGCIHGHCHHGIGVAKLIEAELAMGAVLGDQVLPVPSDAPIAGPSLGLLRPPRA